MSAPTPPSLPGLSSRLWLCGLGVCTLLGLGAGRLFDIQVVRHETYRARRDQQAFTEVPVPATRGRIYFWGSEIAAISREQAPSVFVDPKLLNDLPSTAGALAYALDLPATEVLEKLERYQRLGRRFCWIKRLVSPPERARILALDVRGVELRYESDRAYPRGPVAGGVIGFTNRDGVGIEGLERTLEPLLKGTDGTRRHMRDALGHPISMPESAHTPPVPGCDVTLTIDVNAQELAQRELAAQVERWGAQWGAVLVLETATGAIRAWAQVPTFDPNDPAASEVDARRNRALTDPMPIGSAMKMFSVGTALLTGAVHPETKIDCAGGHWRYLGRNVTDFHPYGGLTVRDVLMKSSNIGSVKAVLAMGKGKDKKAAAMDAWTRLAAGLEPFGFGHSTGIELGGEAKGYVGALDPAKRSYHTPISVAMGYECMVNMVQLAAAVNAIGNDGIWVPPHVVARIDAPDGTVLPIEGRPEPHRAWPAPHAALMREILATVVSDHGTARLAQVEGLSVAGKTSTVKKLVNGKFADDKSRCLFSCFAPADKPVYTVIVVVDEPRHGGRKEQTGGRVAAPVAARVLATLLGHPLPEPPEPKIRRDPVAQSATPPAPGASTPRTAPLGPPPLSGATASHTPDNDTAPETPEPWVSSRLLRAADERRERAHRASRDDE